MREVHSRPQIKRGTDRVSEGRFVWEGIEEFEDGSLGVRSTEARRGWKIPYFSAHMRPHENWLAVLHLLLPLICDSTQLTFFTLD